MGVQHVEQSGQSAAFFVIFEQNIGTGFAFGVFRFGQ